MTHHDAPRASRARPGRLGSVSLIVMILVILVVVEGCAIGGGRPRSGGSGLSQAAEEAKKEPEDKRKTLEAGRPVEETQDDEDTQPEAIALVDPEAPKAQVAATEHAPGSQSIYQKLHMGVVGGFGMITGDQLGSYGVGGFQVGAFITPRWRADVLLLGTSVNFSDASGLNQPFKGEYEAAVDISGRYYLTRENTFVGVYPIAGMRFGSLNWDYAQPIFVVDENGNHSVASDGLTYFCTYLGIGTSLVQTRHFHLGAQLIGGGRFYEDHTHQGLANDLFADATFGQLLFEATVPF